jgi:hypothetical protein
MADNVDGASQEKPGASPGEKPLSRFAIALLIAAAITIAANVVVGMYSLYQSQKKTGTEQNAPVKKEEPTPKKNSGTGMSADGKTKIYLAFGKRPAVKEAAAKGMMAYRKGALPL